MLIGINGGYFPAICRVCFIVHIALMISVLLEAPNKGCLLTAAKWQLSDTILPRQDLDRKQMALGLRHRASV